MQKKLIDRRNQGVLPGFLIVIVVETATLKSDCFWIFSFIYFCEAFCIYYIPHNYVYAGRVLEVEQGSFTPLVFTITYVLMATDYWNEPCRITCLSPITQETQFVKLSFKVRSAAKLGSDVFCARTRKEKTFLTSLTRTKTRTDTKWVTISQQLNVYYLNIMKFIHNKK